MKKGGKARQEPRITSVRTPRTKAAKARETAAPTVETVAAKIVGLFPTGEPPAPWKEAELRRRLEAAERPLLAEALTRLREERRVLALPQGTGVVYLFAGPLREWLAGAPTVGGAEPAVVETRSEPTAIFAAYASLVRRSGGFPDVKIAALRAALDPEGAEGLPARLTGLWREGRATLSQGDWSLADEATRAAAVELHGERYLLVRLEG